MNIEKQLIEQESYLCGLAQQVLSMAQKQAQWVEVNIQKVIGINLQSRMAKIEHIEFNNDCLLTLTVFNHGHRGFVSTSNFSSGSISKAIQAAIDVAKYTNSDPCAGLADKCDLVANIPQLPIYFPKDINITQATEQTIQLEKQALTNPLIKQSEGAFYSQQVALSIYTNNHGIFSSYKSSRYHFGLSLIANSSKSGEMVRDGYSTITRDYIDLLPEEKIIQQATMRTLARCDARKLVTQRVPVIFTPEMTRTLFGHFAAAISGTNLYRKNSFLLNSLGELIFPRWLTIHEDPFISKGLATVPHDAEGVVVTPRDIIHQGRLQSYLLNSYSARKLNTRTTGHAGGIHNWSIQSPVSYSFQQLVKKMGRGVIISELMGSGVNMITGDYSRGAIGFWVENGEIQFPIHEITVAGNLKAIFNDIVALGNDIDYQGSIRTGSLLIKELQIAGL